MRSLFPTTLQNPELLSRAGADCPARRRLTKTKEEETIIINRSDRSTYPEEKSVSRSGATPLFNITEGNRPVLRKVSAHGLGHLRDPYSEDEAPSSIPPPAVGLKKLGVKRWQYDLWYKITEAALAGDPDNVQLDWHPALQRPATIRYAASSPKLLDWMARLNEGRPYQEQIRPFNFLLAFMPRTGVFAPFSEEFVNQLR